MLFDISDVALTSLRLSREEFNDAYQMCSDCDGAGKWDILTEHEQECSYCQGRGYTDIGDVFDSKQDAWTAND